MGKLINVLIRTSNREKLFNRAVQSVKNQTYKNVRIIVAADSKVAFSYSQLYANILIMVSPDRTKTFYWNLYCNTLKEAVDDGWFFFLDDDDFIRDKHALESIAMHLEEDKATICQFSRMGNVKPSNEMIENKQIVRGKIGMPCIFLHHSMKHIAQFDGMRAADYRFIQEVSTKANIKYVPVVVVTTDNRGLKGNCE